jgi:hypothetical protein
METRRQSEKNESFTQRKFLDLDVLRKNNKTTASRNIRREKPMRRGGRKIIVANGEPREPRYTVVGKMMKGCDGAATVEVDCHCG